VHNYFSVLKIQFGQQTFWGKQGIKSTIHKLLLNLLQKEMLISGLTGWSGEKIQTQIIFFHSGWNIPCWITGRNTWTFAHSSSLAVHKMPVNHVDIVQSLTVRWRSKSVNITFSTKYVIPKCYCLLQFILSTFILHCCLHFILSTSRFVSWCLLENFLRQMKNIRTKT